jgi:hypothetical protein
VEICVLVIGGSTHWHGAISTEGQQRANAGLAPAKTGILTRLRVLGISHAAFAATVGRTADCEQLGSRSNAHLKLVPALLEQQDFGVERIRSRESARRAHGAVRRGSGMSR